MYYMHTSLYFFNNNKIIIIKININNFVIKIVFICFVDNFYYKQLF